MDGLSHSLEYGQLVIEIYMQVIIARAMGRVVYVDTRDDTLLYQCGQYVPTCVPVIFNFDLGQHMQSSMPMYIMLENFA